MICSLQGIFQQKKQSVELDIEIAKKRDRLNTSIKVRNFDISRIIKRKTE